MRHHALACLYGLLPAVLLLGACDPGDLTISGKVLEEGSGLEGVAVTLSGETFAETTTAEDGSFLFEDLAEGAYRVTPYRHGYVMSDKYEEVAISTASATGLAFEAEARDARWTLLVQFAIDNDLGTQPEITDLLAGLEVLAGLDDGGLGSDSIEVAVLMDGSDDSPYADGYYHLTGSLEEDFAGRLAGPAELNSGDPHHVNAFVDWAVQAFPADRFVYIIFDHGGGFDDPNEAGFYGDRAGGASGGISVQGVGKDEPEEDALSHREVSRITEHIEQRTGYNVDLFWAFACLMGGVELAYEVRESVDYAIFSEAIFYLEDWGFDALFPLLADPGMHPRDLGAAVVESAEEHYTGPGIHGSLTLSAVDVSRVGRLYETIDHYAEDALSVLAAAGGEARAEFLNDAAEQAWRSWDMFEAADSGGAALAVLLPTYYADIGDYFQFVADGYLDYLEQAGFQATPAEASLVINAGLAVSRLSDCVVRRAQQGNEKTTGMTIFQNWWQAEEYLTIDYGYDPALYRSILDFGSNRWADFIQRMDGLDPDGIDYGLLQ